MLKELKWLSEQGLALHWLYKESKRPIGQNWQAGPRKSWAELEKEFTKGHNVGVRTGEPSKLKDGNFLYILDVDVKSDDPEDAKEAYGIVKAFLGRSHEKHPVVTSGRGGFSLHVYFKSNIARGGFNLFQSKKQVKVVMPSVKPSKREIETLTGKEVKLGVRLRPAFEIDVLGTGKQAVIPPSIHPDTKKPYKWKTPFAECKDIPLVAGEKLKTAAAKARPETASGPGVEAKSISELGDWQKRVSHKFVSLIENMKGLENYNNDRSAAVYATINALCMAGFNDSEIVGILGEPLHAISEVVIDRVGTDEKKISMWLTPQVRKVRSDIGSKFEFDDPGTTEGTDWEDFDDPEYLRREGEKNYQELGGWKTELDKTNSGGIKINLKNTLLFLRNVSDPKEWLGFNEVSQNCEFLGHPPWSKDGGGPWVGKGIYDEDVVACQVWLSRGHKYEPPKHLMNDALMHLAFKNAFNPVKNYLRNLTWDGVKRIDTWLIDFMGAEDSAYTRAVSRKILVAMVARAFEPGCKFDHVPILEGDQDLGKSTMLRVLSEPWFGDSLGDVTNKDVIGTIQGKWLVEVAELSAMDKATTNAFKEFVTKQTDRARMAYERNPKDYPRRCVFVGTTNDDEYLKDPTGSRRYWPIVVARSDYQAVRACRDQLFAEAFLAYKSGQEKLYLDSQNAKAIWREITGQKQVSDDLDFVVKGQLARWVALNPFEDEFRQSALSFWEAITGRGVVGFNKSEQMRLTTSLKRVGLKRLKTNGVVLWCANRDTLERVSFEMSLVESTTKLDT